MDEYITRLYRCGIPMHDAWMICQDFRKSFSLEALEEYVAEIERDR